MPLTGFDDILYKTSMKHILTVVMLAAGTAPATAREAIVLYDNVYARSKPFITKSAIAGRYNTGDIVDVVDQKSKSSGKGPDNQWYQIRQENQSRQAPAKESVFAVQAGTTAVNGTAWINGNAALIFLDQSLFNDYMNSTYPIKDILRWRESEAAKVEQAKINVIDSKEFFIRAAKNPNPKIRKYLGSHIDYRLQ